MLLRNCRLIPELSGMIDYQHADIEMEHGCIKRITKAGSASSAEPGIDCKGLTLLPGLFDLHAHVSIASAQETPMDAMRRLVEAMGRLKAYSNVGVTTMRDCGSTVGLAIALRDAVSRGVVKGPRVLASGYILAPEVMTYMGRQLMMVMDIANSEDEFRYIARRQLAQGADFIKLYASESASQCVGNDPRPILRREEVRAVVEIAEMAGTHVAAHAHSLSSIKLCIEEGVRSIEHATFIDPQTIKELEQHPDVFLTPTFAVLCPTQADDPSSKEWTTKRHMLEIAAENIGNAYRAGHRLGFGSDLINGDMSQFFQEFKIRSELCGMKNVDILLQATKYSAEIVGLGGVTGEVKESLAADLILVNGNPDEDISVMYQPPLMVLQGGQLLKSKL